MQDLNKFDYYFVGFSLFHGMGWGRCTFFLPDQIPLIQYLGRCSDGKKKIILQEPFGKVKLESNVYEKAFLLFTGLTGK